MHSGPVTQRARTTLGQDGPSKTKNTFGPRESTPCVCAPSAGPLAHGRVNHILRPHQAPYTLCSCVCVRAHACTHTVECVNASARCTLNQTELPISMDQHRAGRARVQDARTHSHTTHTRTTVRDTGVINATIIIAGALADSNHHRRNGGEPNAGGKSERYL